MIFALLEVLQSNFIAVKVKLTMITITLSWLSFITFVSLLQELTQLQYFLYSSCMLCFNCLYNLIYSVKIPAKVIVLILTIPSIIFWYVAFVYNDFLSLTPMKSEMFVILFFYLCVLLFIVCSQKTQQNDLKRYKDDI